ncbi:Aste57867_10123 [Aphanomyces stellatus]|uniref:Transmembrane protein 198 n=1 Tax=Aphanomyces stellatus TaxID=120398 RepID=A0A485KPK5_9STRA|nr:hypothetical protein As57867_010084 [Aphanomyces stellatus]VFT86999.1 Aste57867_10123 [Aphanomyces stellatus]
MSIIHLWLGLVLFHLAGVVSVTPNVTIDGNSAFDNQVNKILHWDGSGQSLGVGPDIVAIAAIATGLALVSFGYKLLRPAIFLSAFVVGAVVAFVAAEKFVRGNSNATTLCWIAFAAGGLLLGALVLCLYPLGVFLLGAFAGLLLATQLQTSFAYTLSPAHPNTVFLILLAVCGLACGALALALERPFFIVATAWSGAIVAAWGVGYFAGGYPNAANLQKHLRSDQWIYDVPTTWWLYVAGTVVVALVGMWVQFRCYRRAQLQSKQLVTYFHHA